MKSMYEEMEHIHLLFQIKLHESDIYTGTNTSPSFFDRY